MDKIMQPEDTQELKLVVGMLNRTLSDHGASLKSIDNKLGKLVIVEERHYALDERFNDHRKEVKERLLSVEADVRELKSLNDRSYWIRQFVSRFLPVVLAIGIIGSVVIGAMFAIKWAGDADVTIIRSKSVGDM